MGVIRNQLINLFFSPEDQKLIERIDNSPKSMRIEGRGAIKVDLEEIQRNSSIEELRTIVEKVFEEQNSRSKSKP